jgi:hypothetical protein
MKVFKKNNQNKTDIRPRERRAPSTFTGERERPTIFSYRAQRGERTDNLQRMAPAGTEATQRLGKERRLRLYRRLRVGALAVALIVLVVGQSIITGAPHIVFDGEGGAAYHYETSAYAGTAAKLAGDSIFNKTKWTFDTAKLDAGMQRAFPELASVRTTLPLIGNSVVVHLIPGTPTLLLTTASHQTFIIDQRGVAVATADAAQAADNLVTITDLSGIPVQAGKPALPSSTVQFIQTVAAELKSQKITLVAATLPARSSELDIRIAGAGYTGKFNLQADARSQAGTFAAVKGGLDANHTAVGQYIDVRVPGRAYYQ